MARDLKNLRNIGIIAHIDAGKTTVTERMLFYSGQKHRVGEVDKGTTDTDSDREEQQRGITIYAACVTFNWRDSTVNLLDTPGHVDFTAEVERCLRVLDGAVVVFSAREGVEAQSETVWRQADKYQVPRIAFINKLDREGADFFNAVETMIDRLGAKPVAVQIPIGAEDQFVGHIDLVTMKAIRYVDPLGQSWEEDEIPAELKEQAEQYRHDMIETLADHDDEIAEAFLADEEIEQDKLKAAIRAATLDITITPVLLGSAFKNKGVQPLLDAVIDYLPSPVDVPAVTGTDPKTGEPTEREARLDAPFSALAFKVMSDPLVCKLTYFRLYSGKLNSGPYVLNPSTDRKERVGRLLEMHANHREDVDQVGAGAIAAAVGLKQTTTGDTLCDPDAPVLLESIDFPDPVIDVAVEPKTKADQDKLTAALQRLAEEDPTFRVRTNEETGQTIIAGMGELHLEIIVDRLLREFKVDANVGRPQVAY